LPEVADKDVGAAGRSAIVSENVAVSEPTEFVAVRVYSVAAAAVAAVP
jgi:hypothetical protein